MNPNQGVELRLCSKRAKGLFKLEKIGPRTQGGDFKNNQNGKDMRENNGEEVGLTPKKVAGWLREVGNELYDNGYFLKGMLLLTRADKVEAIPEWNPRHPDPVKAEIENDAVNSVLNVVAASSDDSEMEKILTMIVSLGISLLRGMKGNQYIEDYLNAAIADTDNIIVIDRQRVN